MLNRNRETDSFTVSFLDVASCGFGAMIILLMIVNPSSPSSIEVSDEDPSATIAELQREVFEIRGQTSLVNRDLNAKREQLSSVSEQVARLRQDLSEVQGQFLASSELSDEATDEIGQLSLAQQSLTDEMQRLLGNSQQAKDQAIGGIPVDSEYVIFIIDTSGSMYNYAWPLVLQKVSETLAVYPRLKGIQVMNDMGNYMFTQYAGAWIPDTDARRRAIIDRLRSWNVFSNSSPVEGITQAISTYYKPGRKISLYVFGDEFSGRSIQRVVDVVDRINRTDSKGNRLVRIHGVGFPVQFANPPRYQETGIKFSILMRTLCEKNGGTFVGLNDFRTY